ncbi:unnamed protein product [Sphagnum tenellum]|uniref:Uncharacterized protein n=1 Tax=Sphagnum jensenii TaxID=128206 RepID=A0ABP0WMR4_9BRYO
MFKVIHLMLTCWCYVFGEQKFAKLEICARNLSGVQQLAGPWNSLENRSEMSERRRQRAGYRGEGNEEEVICPKPRRATNVLGPATEFMKPSRRRQSHSTVRTEGDAGFEILDIFLSKGGYNDTSSFSCSPPYFCGSPPSRSGNPLIHDVQFLHQRAQSVLSQQISSCGPSSYKANPVVRVEGFASSASDSRCRVSALA